MEGIPIIGSLDFATLLFIAFTVFFIGLVIYLQKESRREGFPLETDVGGRLEDSAGPSTPKPKAYHLADGRTVYKPDGVRDPDYSDKMRRLAVWPGAPSEPVGDPMKAGVGPGAYAMRDDIPDRNHEGKTKIVPMRLLDDFHITKQDLDPRGVEVIAADGEVAGVISEIWVDRAEAMVRYYEVEVAEGGRKVLLPFAFVNINKRKRRAEVKAIMAHHFADVPAHASDEQVTRLEEEKISAYYAAGLLYANAQRKEALI